MRVKATNKKTYTKSFVYESVALSLCELLYLNCTPSMIQDVYQAMLREDKEMPYAIVGMFIEGQLQKLRLQIDSLPD